MCVLRCGLQGVGGVFLLIAFIGLAPGVRAEDAPVAASAPVVEAAPVVAAPPVVAPAPLVAAEPVLPEGHAPDVRPRPPEPPPPGGGHADWDKDFRSRGVGLGPPLPPPEPWESRPIAYRHDIRDVSLDARIKDVRRVVQWVDVVERHELTEWRPMDLGDFARRLPNVIVADAGSPFLQFPIIRGLGGPRVKVLTDGVWPTSDVLGIRGTSLSLWDPESTERMEVYHGPGAYLKGLDSPGGMINIVPRRPRRHGRLSADFGGAVGYDMATRAFRGRAEADIGQNRIAGLVGFTWTRRGDRRVGGGDVVQDTSYEQMAADLALDYFIDNRSRIGITAQYTSATDVESPYSVASGATNPSYDRFFLALSISSFDMGGIFGGTKASIALDTLLAKTDDEFSGLNAGIASESDAQRFQFSFQGNLYLNRCHDTWAELTVAYAHLDRTETVIGDCSAICDGADDPTGAGDDLAPNANHRTSPLIAQVFDGATFAEVGECSGFTRSFEAEEILASLLIEDQTHNDCWDTHAGLRFDISHVEDNRVSRSDTTFLVGGAGGVAHHFSPSTTAYTNVSGGWRRPTLDERHSTAVIDGVTVFGNPDLEPEFNVNGELGVKHSLDNHASLQAAGFVHYMDKFIGQVDAPALTGPTAVLDNLGEVWLYGGEITGAWRPWCKIEGAELYGSAGITHSSDIDVVANVPFLWRAGTRYSVPQPRGYRVRRWFVDGALYGASNSRDGVRGGPSFVTGELLLGLGVDFGDFKSSFLNFGLTNLFDADYVPPASRLRAPGISLFAGFQIDM